ncbi:hypothetical protein GIB67_020351 [Kingdonia uniflora]|uniref:Uncharacterized protein n=1 Tax=Kingdonia uniflora TaxID=39325 RepID=A0A7J7LRI1_9MAGN|nr:hypothetical protein GIB67_020351 [Kingdonia uniflora]
MRMLSRFVKVDSVRRLGVFAGFLESFEVDIAVDLREHLFEYLGFVEDEEGEIGDVDGYRVECVRLKRLRHQEWARLHDYCPGSPAMAFITDIPVTVAERLINVPSNPFELTASLITLLLFERSVEGYLLLCVDPFSKVYLLLCTDPFSKVYLLLCTDPFSKVYLLLCVDPFLKVYLLLCVDPFSKVYLLSWLRLQEFLEGLDSELK